ncbi:ATP-binding protein [Erysipelothrix rhusiopathiae]|nr:ATP-binding protein [Erysipelothrix rhusiopathiae]MDE8334310.1 ATP-binding protein [Erysipelothrix rhusiopathiae]
MNEKINFLEPDIDQIRHSIVGIDDSYNNPWDILAEILQNSVDAIREESSRLDCDEFVGKIDLLIDCSSNSITITDNGIGIAYENVPILLRPFSTNKRNKRYLIGEKGVGLTFVVFSSDLFEIVTTQNGKTFKGMIENAYSWKDKRIDSSPSIEQLECSDLTDNGTSIKINGIVESEIFNLNFNQLIFVLRTKTAAGSTKKLINDDIEIEINLEYVSLEGNKQIARIPFKYLTVDELVDDNSKIKYKDFNARAASPEMTDREKSNLIRNKLIYDDGEFVHLNNRLLKYRAIYVPSRSVWNDKSKEYNLATEDQLNLDTWMNEYGFSTLEYGIFLSVKGMPTGISITPPSTGAQGYWNNIFILIEDDQLSFDIGRKSINGQQANIYRKYSKMIFQNFTKIIQKFTAGNGYLDEESTWEKEEIFKKVRELNDLQTERTSFLKEPIGQEASVVGIFYDMIGKGVITNIQPLSSGYKGKYDLYAISNGREVTIEFKCSISAVLKDFNEYIKMFSEIDCIVCWDITNQDIEAFSNVNLVLEEFTRSEFDSRNSKFDQATHKLSGYQQLPIYVIDLKKFV